MDLQPFINWAIGQGSVAKYNDGQFLGECVSLINQYCYRVLNVPAGAWGNAKDWGAPGNAALNYFNVVGDLQPGDILVYGAVSGNPYGHIELYAGNGQSLGQNRNWDRKVRLQPTLGNYIRILRSKTSQGGEMPIPDADNYYNRYKDEMNLKRGRDITGAGFSRDEFRKNFPGKTDLQATEMISDNEEARRAHQWMAIGYQAQKDNWPQQIYNLQDLVNNLNKRPTSEQLAELNKQLEDFKKSADLAENKALAAEAVAAKAIAEKTKLSEQAAKDAEVGNTFSRLLGQWLSKFTGGK